ncbi:anaphase-promoting complex subunit [Mucor ambiguus]|uniref:Anaphase-promoting complex subunit n=1 Tax=Mucor ambiguus TaxID=91626 RepID=A0A0C9MXD4_9FUNG|nr:anaphase-promoting complex subunit [Mucor ambiguus]
MNDNLDDQLSSSVSPIQSSNHDIVAAQDDALRTLEFEHEHEEEDDEYLGRVSGIGEGETEGQDDLDMIEQEQSEREDGSEAEDPKLDDAERESTAIHVYQETHPDREQRHVGGREIGEHEAIWSVSSFRPHWGPDKLRDNNALTYWQSDCPNPQLNHTIDLSFHQATLIRQVSIFIDYFQDESYTPKTIMVRGGTTYRDLQELDRVECEEFVGWVNIDIASKNDGNPFRVFRLQIAILTTHLNGRDTHIRQVKVYSVIPSHFGEEPKQIKQEQITFKKPMANRGLR